MPAPLFTAPGYHRFGVLHYGGPSAGVEPAAREHLGELTPDLYQILPVPRCVINHSCVPNEVSTSDTVYAWRDIGAGEKITVDYRLNAHDDGDMWEIVCVNQFGDQDGFLPTSDLAGKHACIFNPPTLSSQAT